MAPPSNVPVNRTVVANLEPSVAPTPPAEPAITEIPTGSEPSSMLAAVVEEPAPAPAEVVSNIVATPVIGPGPTPAEPTPQLPADAPADWALLAFARRDLEQPLALRSTTPEPSNGEVASGLVTDGSTTDSPSASSLISTDPFASTAIPADSQDLYTGQPSLIQQVVVLALRVVDVVLQPLGGLLNLTSLKVPFFTDGVPPFFLTFGLDVQRTESHGMTVYTLAPPSPSDKQIVALHGGAYAAEVSIFHWETYADLARDTGATVVVPLYPLVPQGTAATVVPNTADLIADLIASHGADNVSVLGDSAGGGLALAAVQQLVKRGSPVPGRMVLWAPWIDVALTDPASRQIDPSDPLLDVPTLQRFGREWAGHLDPSDPLPSPQFGSLAGLPPTVVYSGSMDLLTPQTLALRERALADGLDFKFELRNGLIHDYPIFFFLPEAQAARQESFRQLIGTDAAQAAITSST